MSRPAREADGVFADLDAAAKEYHALPAGYRPIIVTDEGEDIPTDADLITRAADLCARMEELGALLSALEREYAPLRQMVLERDLGDELLEAVKRDA